MGNSFRTLVIDGLALALFAFPFFPFVWNTSWTKVLENLTAPTVESPLPARIPTPEEFTPQWPTATPQSQKTILR